MTEPEAAYTAYERFYEMDTTPDGQPVFRLTVCEPSGRFLFAWEMSPAEATEIALTMLLTIADKDSVDDL